MKSIGPTELFANCPSSIYGTVVFYARAILNLPCTAKVKPEAVLCTAQVETVAVLCSAHVKSEAVLCTAQVKTEAEEVDDINIGLRIMNEELNIQENISPRCFDNLGRQMSCPDQLDNKVIKKKTKSGDFIIVK